MTAITDAFYMVYGTLDMMERRCSIILSPDEKTKQLKLHGCTDVVVVVVVVIIMIILPSNGGCWLLVVGQLLVPHMCED